MRRRSSQSHKRSRAKRLPHYVRDVSTADCVFCPYGTDVKVGDRVCAYDERTEFNRNQRERLVEVTAIKLFRSTGRVVTLDLEKVSMAEVARIAAHSELKMDTLLEHHAGAPGYDPRHPPVVVYFQPCDDDDTVGTRFKMPQRREPGWRRFLKRVISDRRRA